MAILRVLIYGDERLQTPCRAVEKLTPEIGQLIAEMGETMYAASGVGLAAPQVGVLQRLLVLDVDQVGEDGEKNKPDRLRVFINPQIVWTSDEDSPFVEACLSIPGVEAEVYRPTRIRIRYRDERWEEHEEEADSLPARVLQHEVDHLDGILFVDRLSFIKRQALAGQLRRLRKERETICVPVASAGK